MTRAHAEDPPPSDPKRRKIGRATGWLLAFGPLLMAGALGLSWSRSLFVRETLILARSRGHLDRDEELSLIGTQADDEAMSYLRRHQRLRVLNIGETKVTDAGLAHLEGLPKLGIVLMNDHAGPRLPGEPTE